MVDILLQRSHFQLPVGYKASFEKEGQRFVFLVGITDGAIPKLMVFISVSRICHVAEVPWCSKIWDGDETRILAETHGCNLTNLTKSFHKEGFVKISAKVGLIHAVIDNRGFLLTTLHPLYSPLG